MAKRLAKILGTEEDKVNCPFYWKIGACRHGDKCTRNHLRPPISQTLVLNHMYENPPIAIAMSEGTAVPEDKMKQAIKDFEEFYEEIFFELSTYGEIKELNVVDNVGDHLIGNVYVKYASENEAQKAFQALVGRFYQNKKVVPEFSPVTNFRDACCKQHDEGKCTRGGYCNFMHLKPVSRKFMKYLTDTMYKEHPEYALRPQEESPGSQMNRSHSRSRSKDRQKHHRHHKHSRKSRSRDRRGHHRDSSHRDSGSLAGMSTPERLQTIESWNEELEKIQEALRAQSQMDPMQGMPPMPPQGNPLDFGFYPPKI